MRIRRGAQFATSRRAWLFVYIAAVLAGSLTSIAQRDEKSDASANAVTVDRVVAVVNLVKREVILQSDLEDELHLSVLDPNTNPGDRVTPQQALERLISRDLIEQQIQQEDIANAEPEPEEIDARVHGIRTELPACVRADCKSDEGWKTFLARHDLTPERVKSYLRNRLKVLSFIEIRFRQGIRISPEEIETYYREKLVPQYPAGAAVPPLDQVSSRIEEILLEQHVNELFDDWLSNLRKQGQIEVLDPSLEEPESGSPGAAKE